MSLCADGNCVCRLMPFLFTCNKVRFACIDSYITYSRLSKQKFLNFFLISALIIGCRFLASLRANKGVEE